MYSCILYSRVLKIVCLAHCVKSEYKKNTRIQNRIQLYSEYKKNTKHTTKFHTVCILPRIDLDGSFFQKGILISIQQFNGSILKEERTNR